MCCAVLRRAPTSKLASRRAPRACPAICSRLQARRAPAETAGPPHGPPHAASRDRPLQVRPLLAVWRAIQARGGPSMRLQAQPARSASRRPPSQSLQQLPTGYGGRPAAAPAAGEFRPVRRPVSPAHPSGELAMQLENWHAARHSRCTPAPPPAHAAGRAMRAAAVLLLALLAGAASGRRLAQIPAHLLNPGVTTHEIEWDVSRGERLRAGARRRGLPPAALQTASRGSCLSALQATAAFHYSCCCCSPRLPALGPSWLTQAPACGCCSPAARSTAHPPNTPVASLLARSALRAPGRQVRRPPGLPLAGAPGGGAAAGRLRGRCAG